jgi:uncharacterized coiled-coil DUF342 family protein
MKTMLSEKQKIEELNKQLSILKEQKAKIDAEANELGEKRDKLNQQFQGMRIDAQKLRDGRDGANEEVRKLKEERNEMKMGIHEKIQELRGLREEAWSMAKRKPPRSLQSLQEEFESIEWKIQTTHLSLEDEKILIEHVKQIETQINVHKKLGQINQKIADLQAQIKTFEARSELCHERLTAIARKGQENHQKMLARIEESRKTKASADAVHQSLMQAREKAKRIREDIVGIVKQIRCLKDKISQEENIEKTRNEETMRKEIEKQAREKLKRGEKLSWEEFQILAEKGIGTQD